MELHSPSTTEENEIRRTADAEDQEFRRRVEEVVLDMIRRGGLRAPCRCGKD